MSQKSKRTIGVGALVLGAALIVLSMIIQSKVEEGEGQISRAEQSLEQGQRLFSLTPYTRQAGEQLTSGANRKISEGKDEIAYYTQVANVLFYAGIVGIVIGGWCLFFSKKSAR